MGLLCGCVEVPGCVWWGADAGGRVGRGLLRRMQADGPDGHQGGGDDRQGQGGMRLHPIIRCFVASISAYISMCKLASSAYFAEHSHFMICVSTLMLSFCELGIMAAVSLR